MGVCAWGGGGSASRLSAHRPGLPGLPHRTAWPVWKQHRGCVAATQRLLGSHTGPGRPRPGLAGRPRPALAGPGRPPAGLGRPQQASAGLRTPPAGLRQASRGRRRPLEGSGRKSWKNRFFQKCPESMPRASGGLGGLWGPLGGLWGGPGGPLGALGGPWGPWAPWGPGPHGPAALRGCAKRSLHLFAYLRFLVVLAWMLGLAISRGVAYARLLMSK